MDERTLNDLLECSVCLERLDTSSKVLPCQHTFCRKCLEVNIFRSLFLVFNLALSIRTKRKRMNSILIELN